MWNSGDYSRKGGREVWKKGRQMREEYNNESLIMKYSDNNHWFTTITIFPLVNLPGFLVLFGVELVV
jgi:hypothetical protein